MRKLLKTLVDGKWFLSALLIINFFGTIYGFYWYFSQFAETHVLLWPFVANSPLSVLYIFIVLVLLKKGRRSVFWEGLAYFGLIKHGLWTVAIITAYQLSGNVYPENFLLWTGHAGMAMQAVLLWYHLGLPLSYKLAFGISGWYFFNDFLDYVVGIHPRVDPVISLAFVRNLALGLSAVLCLAFILTAARHAKKT